MGSEQKGNEDGTVKSCTFVQPHGICTALSRIPNNKSHGLYSCPTQILKCSSNAISNTLAEIINLSISTGVYTNKLKMAKIVPIFKTDDDTDPNNYRPISLLSNFNRIFEKLIFKRMESLIEQHNLFSPSQYGFRKTLSTQWSWSCGVFIDLKKAFDTVAHKILLHKLNHFGFRGVINKWFSSYLQGRTQTTQIGHFRITSGLVFEASLGAHPFICKSVFIQT